MPVTTRKLEIEEFARRVERLCDFLIDKIVDETGRNGSDDLKVIEKIKEDAADIQAHGIGVAQKTFEGLYNYVIGPGVVPDKEN